MSLSALISALVAIAKVTPTFAAWADQLAEMWREQRRTATHARIDAAIAQARQVDWRCPAACPHRGLHDAAGSGGSPAGAP